MDGPLSMSSVMRAVVFERVGEEGFHRQVQALANITPQRIQELAQIYLRHEDFLTVLVSG
jgi:hypothetical protein